MQKTERGKSYLYTCCISVVFAFRMGWFERFHAELGSRRRGPLQSWRISAWALFVFWKILCPEEQLDCWHL